jgi:hypothetical protein
MRYRIPLLLVAAAAVIGLSAPAALASSDQPPLSQASTTCSVGTTYGPYHVVSNDNTNVGITYHGTVNQVTLTTNTGDSRFEVATCVDGSPFYVIHNAAGNCLRMHDKSSGYGVYEENGCELSNTLEQWGLYQGDSSNTYLIENVGTGLFMGVTCPAQNGSPVIGQSGDPGTCVNWQLLTP